jgi:omega-6 fatty acid desaturase (delta-12 desaturase)
MFKQPGTSKTHILEPQWYQDIKKYEQPDIRKSIIQLISTLIPYAGSWLAIIWMINKNYSLWLILPFVLTASVFLVRIFILFHDCTHNSFFVSRKTNRIWGYILGVLTLTPYEKWQHSHNIHHNTYADLDNRGIGDIWTLTVKEYLALPWHKKLYYRLYRSPLIMFTMGPIFIFLFDHRLIIKGSSKKIKFSVFFNNLALAVFLCVIVYLKIQMIYFWLYLLIMILAGAMGIWLFYVQHQFEGVYWARHDEWDPLEAAFKGSSYYKLPKILQWLTANIGLHTIHHLRVSIPNYNLQQCYDETPDLHIIRKLSLKRSIKSLWLNLWDEEKKQLVSFHSLKNDASLL